MPILLCVLDGDEKDYIEQLFVKYKTPLYFFLLKLLDSSEAAEDVVQTVFINILNNIDKIQSLPVDYQKNYIYRIAKNAAIDYERKNKKRDFDIQYNDEVISVLDSTYASSIIANQNLSDILEEGLNSLKESEQDIIIQKYGFGFSDTQISKFLNISEEAVRKRVSRAKLRLASLIIERNPEVQNGR